VSYDGAVAPPQPFTAGAPAAPGVPQADITPYRTTVNLLSVSGLGIGLSLDQFGPAVGGSAELLFQDILGNHLIDVAAQASGSLDTLAGQLLYSNTANRIAWGIGVAHVPQANYVFLAPPFSVAGADTAIVQQQIFYEEADVQAMYPLSVNRRLEGDIGYTGIWYEQMAPVFYYQGGVQVAEDQVSLATPPPLNLAHAGLAWVGDYSFQGFTDPVRGSRYRFELDGYTGSVSFLSAIADARAYLFLNPFTVAFRALSTGRYLGGADNPTLGSYYLGDPSLVRGYEYYSIISNEGASAAGGDVPQIDRLFGSKVAVVNAELRLPVLGNGELGLFNFSALPVSLVGFFDGGVAWTESSFPVFQPTSNPSARIPVFSAGAAVRVNLLGAAILQIYWAWPFQRPDIGGSWGFLIEAGW
jgi:hypothetical protein